MTPFGTSTYHLRATNPMLETSTVIPLSHWSDFFFISLIQDWCMNLRLRVAVLSTVYLFTVLGGLGGLYQHQDFLFYKYLHLPKCRQIYFQRRERVRERSSNTHRWCWLHSRVYKKMEKNKWVKIMKVLSVTDRKKKREICSHNLLLFVVSDFRIESHRLFKVFWSRSFSSFWQ